MKKIYGIALSLVAGAIAFWLIFTQFSIKEVVDSLAHAPVWAVASYVLVSIGIMATLAWRWHNILKTKGHKISFWHVFWYKVAGYGVSYLTPGAKIGGEAIRATLLKRNGVSFKDGLGTVVIDKIMEITTSGFFFIIGALVAFISYQLPVSIKIMSLLITAWVTIFFGYFYIQMFRGKPCFKNIFRLLQLHRIKRLRGFEHKLIAFEKTIMHFYQKKRGEFFVTLLISLFSWTLMFLEYELILTMLGIHGVTFNELFLIITFIGASYLLPVPMALGALEAGQLSVFKVIGFKQASGIALALVTRTKDLVWTLLGFAAISLYGLNFSKSVKDAKMLTEEIGEVEGK